MLKIINARILVAILAAVAAVGAYLIHEHNLHERQAADAARAVLLLQQQRDADAAARKHDAETWEFVKKQHGKNNVNPVHGSKPWTHYLP